MNNTKRKSPVRMDDSTKEKKPSMKWLDLMKRTFKLLCANWKNNLFSNTIPYSQNCYYVRDVFFLIILYFPNTLPKWMESRNKSLKIVNKASHTVYLHLETLFRYQTIVLFETIVFSTSAHMSIDTYRGY